MNAITDGGQSHSHRVVEPLDEWLDHDDEAFVGAAYRRLLGRAPDPAGLGNYVEKLRAGVPKTEILAELRQSDEYRNRLMTFPGMHEPSHAVSGTHIVPAVPAAGSLQRLMAYEDREFVACAYRTLLGREADASGMSTYVRELRRGTSKLRILHSLRRSAEGRRWAAGLPGLDRAIRRYQWARIPVFGRIAALIWTVERDTPLEMALRRLENRLYVLGGGWESEFRPEEPPAAKAITSDLAAAAVTAASSARPSIRPAGAALSVLRTLPNQRKENDC